MRQHTHYEILGIANTATDDQIRKAYKHRSLIYHPDKIGALAEKNRKSLEVSLNETYGVGAEAYYKMVQAAHETLIKPKARKAYDATLNNAQSHSVGKNENTEEKTKDNNSFYFDESIFLRKMAKAAFDLANPVYRFFGWGDIAQNLKLQCAVKYNNSKKAEEAIEAGASVHIGIDKIPILRYAAQRGYFQIAEILIQKTNCFSWEDFEIIFQTKNDDLLKALIKREMRINPAGATLSVWRDNLAQDVMGDKNSLLTAPFRWLSEYWLLFAMAKYINPEPASALDRYDRILEECQNEVGVRNSHFQTQ